MWTETTRPKYERKGLRYKRSYRGGVGRDRMLAISNGWDARERRTCARLVNAILYMARTRCQWRMLPKDFPIEEHGQEYFYRFAPRPLNGIPALLMRDARPRAERPARPPV